MTESASEQILSLPMYAELTPASIAHVASAIHNFGTLDEAESSSSDGLSTSIPSASA